MTTRTQPATTTGRRSGGAAVYRPLFSAPADPTTTDAITGAQTPASVAPITGAAAPASNPGRATGEQIRKAMFSAS